MQLPTFPYSFLTSFRPPASSPTNSRNMSFLSIFLPLLLLLLRSILANPLNLTPPQSLNLALFAAAAAAPVTTPKTNITGTLSSEIGCFKPTKIPPFRPTNKQDCEAALDAWVRGQSLIQPRKFSRNPIEIDGVALPLGIDSGSCTLIADVLGEGDEDVLTLAEVYAELMGPDGLLKNCLGQVRRPPIGGRMSLGGKNVLKVVVTGK